MTLLSSPFAEPARRAPARACPPPGASALAVAVAVCSLACGGEPPAAAPTGDGEAPALASAAGIQAAVRAPVRGAFTMRGHVELRVTEGSDAGRVLEALTEDLRVSHSADGSFHARQTNSAGHGREVIHQGGLLWVRPGHGKFHRRPPSTPEEPGALLADLTGWFPAAFALVAGAVEVVDAGPVRIGERSARKLSITLGLRPVASGALAGAVPRAVSGDALVDTETGALLGGRLTVEIPFQREGRAMRLALTTEQTLDTLDTPVVVTPPPAEESAPTPERLREVDDRAALLEGIAAPAPRQRAPEARKEDSR